MKAIYFLLLFSLIFSGCSTKIVQKHSLKTKNSTSLALYDEYKRWYKTPYKYGGVSKDGVDCSGFVQSVYRNAFGVRIPRTTKEQSKIGYLISKNSTDSGDVLLFKTGYDSFHSAIYLEDGNFIHSSSKYGVMISNLNNPYWKRTYWQSRRVLNLN